MQLAHSDSEKKGDFGVNVCVYVCTYIQRCASCSLCSHIRMYVCMYVCLYSPSCTLKRQIIITYAPLCELWRRSRFAKLAGNGVCVVFFLFFGLTASEPVSQGCHVLSRAPCMYFGVQFISAKFAALSFSVSTSNTGTDCVRVCMYLCVCV
ncbi:unnamed protein product [Ceratitis capitata]|uniref:(Mediterranean fruit fly) hypothetical protein n=1 Tax=Ceratitis capitata TaxID=7213 RepID=A0A811VAT6_CERCA|nr:unnamed protein product [Ceratitis capitata]